MEFKKNLKLLNNLKKSDRIINVKKIKKERLL